MINLFFNNFTKLAKQNGTSVNAVAKKLGIASGTITAWKNGSEPKQSNIKKIADYFNVSADYLLGRTDDPAPGTTPQITLDDFTIALHDETKELSEADKAELLMRARHMNELRKLKKEKYSIRDFLPDERGSLTANVAENHPYKNKK